MFLTIYLLLCLIYNNLFTREDERDEFVFNAQGFTRFIKKDNLLFKPILDYYKGPTRTERIVLN